MNKPAGWNDPDSFKIATELIRERVSIADVVRTYSNRELRQNRCRCPICDDGRKDAFSIGPRKNRFHCFRCGASGDAVDFVKAVLGLNYSRSVKRINADFRIVDFDEQGETTHAAYSAALASRGEKERRYREAREEFERWDGLMCAYLQWLKAFPPGDRRHDDAERELSTVSYKRDCAEAALKSLEQ